MDIRRVEEKDYNNIYDLVKQAFKTAKISYGKEQDFVVKLRRSANYIPDLEFVAEENKELIGHIMFTAQKIGIEKGEIVALLVAPLYVKLENRNMLVGSKLMKYGIEQAKKLDYKACFLVGDPKYYNRLGFKKITDFNIKNLTNIPDEFMLGYEIEENYLNNINGIIKEIAE